MQRASSLPATTCLPSVRAALFFLNIAALRTHRRARTDKFSCVAVESGVRRSSGVERIVDDGGGCGSDAGRWGVYR
jgi:hypothetical protein